MIKREHKELFGTSGAIFTTCERYRYLLWRTWGEGRSINFLMLNPSTADERANDPTVERCQRRAEMLGYGRLVVTNLFAYRATLPADMLRQTDPVGAANDYWILETARSADIVVCAWGLDGSYLGRSAEVLAKLRSQVPEKLRALKLTATGEPWHPLYVSYATELIDFSGAAA